MKKLPLLSLIGVALVALSFIALNSNPEVEVTLYDVISSDSLEESTLEPAPDPETPSASEHSSADEADDEEILNMPDELPNPIEELPPADESDEEDLPSSDEIAENAEPVEAESLVDTTAFNASTDIQLTAVISEANQTVVLNKYFANAFTVDRGDGSAVQNVTAAITHTYTGAGIYYITLTKTPARWLFATTLVPLIPKAWTTASNVYVSSMPPMSLFGTSAASVGINFFAHFNRDGALTSLPVGSFNTSSISGTVGDNFFYSFNANGTLASLPAESFDMSHITTVGSNFFNSFNYNGTLTSLPEWSFDTSSISGTVGNSFFAYFNGKGVLTSLPAGSFDTSHITTVGDRFFYYFNSEGALASLPEWSFNTSSISGTVGTYFFAYFNSEGALASLPVGSFNTSSISGTVGDYFFDHFNRDGALTSLPVGSFDMSHITTVGLLFFAYFNQSGALTSLPVGSFNTSSISGTVGVQFFAQFNYNGALMSLPAGSFDTSHITTVGNEFFYYFNNSGALTSLPVGSFDTSSISGTVGTHFFSSFNSEGALTSLPEWSFDTSNITTVGMNFFLRFNFEGALTSLPVGSFDTSHITTVGNNFFAYSFCNNQLSRDTILQVASKRNLDQTNLNNRYRVFDWTFSGNAVTGSVTEADIPQLAFNPNSVRNTFAGTNLTTTSANYQNWGLLQLTPPNAIVFYTPTSGTRTSGTVLATLTANKPLLPLTWRTDLGSWTIFTQSFSENTGFSFIITDQDGLTGIVNVLINNIDTAAPSISSVMGTPTAPTTGSVVITITASDAGAGLNDFAYSFDDGDSWQATTTKVFTGNQMVSVKVRDAVGNISSSTYEISNIIIPPVCSVSYSTLAPTNQPVLVTLTGCNKSVTPRPQSIELTENGTGIFEFNDGVGNTGSVEYEVENIDTTPPVAITDYEPQEVSEDPIIVIITLDKPGTVPGWTLVLSWAYDEDEGFGTVRTKTYTENATEEVIFYDVLGNEGSTTVEVTTILSPSDETSNWWDGGGGSSLIADKCPAGDFSSGYYDGECGTEEHYAPDEEDSTKTLYETVYQRAKGYGITTAYTYEDARISDAILRQEMAKMISTYAIKLLDKTPDTSKVECTQFQDVSEVPTELQPYIIQSCQLGLMGMHGDGIQVQDNFFPKSFISRAEVGAILSRLFRGTTYATQEGDETYYTRHLQALKKAGIMNFISNPDMLELRGNILLMLWKSVTK